MALTRRDLLKSGVAVAATSSVSPLFLPRVALAQGKRGGILRVRGYDPPHFDPHLTLNFKTNNTLSFVHAKLVRHKVGAGVTPGSFVVEPDLAERWEEPDDRTVVFYLRKGVRWQNKPPVNGRELIADDVKFTYDRFLTEKGNPLRYMLDPVDRVEVVDRYTVRFRLKEPFVWLPNMLANPLSTWIVAREVVEKYGDLKKAETAIGTGPFTLERYDPNVKTVFRRNPDYFRSGEPRVDGVEWVVMDDAVSALAAYRAGKLDCGAWHWWSVRQQDIAAMKKSHPHLLYQDFLSTVTHRIWMRTDKPPFNDVRVRRAISHALDRQGLIEAVWMRGQPSPDTAPGLAEWSLPIDQLGEGAKYYQYDPQEARRLLAEAGYAKGLKTTLTTTGGYGRDLIDAAQIVQRYLKEVGLEVELKIQEYGAYQATTGQGKFEGLAMGPYAVGWEADSSLYGPYMPDQPRNRSRVKDPKLAAMVQEQRRIKDPEARKQLIFAIQRYAAEQQYYVYLASAVVTASWQPY